MADIVFVETDAETILARVLTRYKDLSGNTLQPADPRRLFLQAIVYELSVAFAGINFAGNQNLIRNVSDLFIEGLAALWGTAAARRGALKSQTTLRFTTSGIDGATYTVAAGKRATDGTHLWSVKETTVSAVSATYVDAVAECTVAGAASNDVVPGQIDTLVDDIPGISAVTNTVTTSGGRDVEALEDYRQRIRDIPESSSVAGPRVAYEALAKGVEGVEDAVALGPYDASDIGGTVPDPGEVHVLIMESGAETPSAGLITDVETALTDETVRPLCDYVIVRAPSFVSFNIGLTYYVARSRAAQQSEIDDAVDAAVESYKSWQRKIGRDINPSELIYRIIQAGAKRVVLTEPAYTAIMRDECSRLAYETVTSGGIEND